MYNEKQLIKKGFLPTSQSVPHKPPISCSVTDFDNLPKEIQTKYNERPQVIGRSRMHHLKRTPE
jgi:hypothetical protein